MRRYRPDYKSIGISIYRFDELLAFCRQYPEKKAEAEMLLGVGSPSLSGMPHGSGACDPVARAAEKRERLLHDCAVIEKCAGIIDDGRYRIAIIQNVCYGRGYEFIKEYLPTFHRQSFFSARRKFYYLLNKCLELRDKFDEWYEEMKRSGDSSKTMWVS